MRKVELPGLTGIRFYAALYDPCPAHPCGERVKLLPFFGQVVTPRLW